MNRKIFLNEKKWHNMTRHEGCQVRHNMTFGVFLAIRSNTTWRTNLPTRRTLPVSNIQMEWSRPGLRSNQPGLGPSQSGLRQTDLVPWSRCPRKQRKNILKKSRQEQGSCWLFDTFEWLDRNISFRKEESSPKAKGHSRYQIKEEINLILFAFKWS